MISPESVSSIAVFNCGYTCPNIQAERGQYHDIFAALLEPSFDRVRRKIPTTTSQKLTSQIRGYDTTLEEYPDTLDDIDAIIITGSPNGAYQDLKWIKTLDRYISYIYTAHPSIKLYGSCFGHQVICASLFRGHGVRVEKDPAGWELGLQTIDLTSAKFLSRFSNLLPQSTPRSLRLQFLHGDHVLLPNPDALPHDVHVIGQTAHCKVQGVYQPGRILTLQGHPEFDRFIEVECLKLVAKRVGWEEGFTEKAIRAASVDGGDDDACVAADIIMAFFLSDEGMGLGGGV